MAGEVTTNAPQQPNPMGGAPTTTEDVQGEITPRPVDQTSAAANQSASPANDSSRMTGATPSPTSPAATGSPAPTTPAEKATTPPPQSKLHPMSHMFDSMLKLASGGPIIVTDPMTGQRREVPQTRGSMARAITAAALTGLFTPNQYRPGPFGGSVLDKGNTVAAAGQAGEKVFEDRQKKFQETANDMESRRMLTLQNNVKLATQMAALTHQKHIDLDEIVTRNQEKFMKPLQSLNEQRASGEPSYFVGQGQTADQLLAGGHKYTDSNVFVDGTVDKVNPETGQSEPQPTYGIVRTTDSNGKPLMLNLPKEVTDELGKFSRPYEQAYDLTKGNVSIPINNYMDAVHTANTLGYMENFLNRVNTQINGEDAKSVDFAAEFKKNPNGFMPAIKTLESAMASGTGRDEGTDDQLIRALRSTPYGSNLVGLIGKTEDVDKWAQKKQDDREEAYRESVSIGTAKGKVMWTPISATNAPGIIADANQPPVRRIQAQTVLDIVANQKERIAKAEQSVRAGDPEQAGQLLASGQLSLSELKSRGSTPDFIIKATQAAMKADPTYNAQQADAEFNIAKNNTNSVFFGSAKSLTDPGGTLELLQQTHSALGNTRIPLFNSWKDALEFQTGDPNLGAFMQVAVGVADDYAKVLGNGQPTEGMQLMQLNSMANKFNDGQMTAIVGAMRSTVNSQVNSRIGKNRILRQMYGTQMRGMVNPPAPGKPAPTQPQTPNATPDEKKQTALQSITMPDGTHPADIIFGPNGSMMVWSGKAGDPWVNPAASKGK